MTDKEKEILSERVQKAVNELHEHCSSVQIIVTHCDMEGTVSIKKGSGDWYARQGAAREFIEEDQARTHHHMKPPTPPDEGDNWKGA